MVVLIIFEIRLIMIKELYNRFFYCQYELIYKINGSNDRLWAAYSATIVLSIIYTLNFMFLSSIFNIFRINLMYISFMVFFFAHYWFYLRKKFFLILESKYGNDKLKNKYIGILILVLFFAFTFVLSLINHMMKS